MGQAAERYERTTADESHEASAGKPGVHGRVRAGAPDDVVASTAGGTSRSPG